MSLLEDYNSPKHDCHVYFIADCSQNMTGLRIASLNDAIENLLLPMIEELNSNSSDVNVIVKVLCVNNDPKIIFSSDLNSFVWHTINASGDFYFGRALACLTDDVKRNFRTHNFDPIFILLSSSCSIDLWQFYLKRLYNVDAFNYGHKIAVAIGDDCNTEILQAFTKHDSHIIIVHNIDKLKNLIRFTWSYPEWDACSNDSFEKCIGDIGLIIDQAVASFGKEVLLSPRIINILNDYKAFVSDQAKLFIFKTIQKNPQFKNLIYSEDWYYDSVSFSTKLAQNTGIDCKKIQSVIDEIGFGLNQTLFNS